MTCLVNLNHHEVDDISCRRLPRDSPESCQVLYCVQFGVSNRSVVSVYALSFMSWSLIYDYLCNCNKMIVA